MAYLSTHYLATFNGTLGTSAETWSFGLRMTATDPNVPATEAMATDLFNAFKNNCFSVASASGGKFPADHKLQYVKMVRIGTDGHYPPTDVAALSSAVAASGGYVTPPALMPWQSSVVASLVTAVPRGLAHAGRIYLPPLGIAPSADGLLTQATVDALADQVRDTITAINALSYVGAVSIFSKGKFISGSPDDGEPDVYGTGATNAVTGVKIGRAYDTQRRRRKGLPETYTTTYLV